MKCLQIATVVTILAIFTACASRPPPAPPVGTTMELCDGVHKMIAQEISSKYDVTRSRTFAANLSAAAKADVAYIKRLSELSAQGTLDSKLGSEIKAVIEVKSGVSQSYFEQDGVFATAICWFNNELERDNLTAEDSEFWKEQKKEMARNRVEYVQVLTGLKKK